MVKKPVFRVKVGGSDITSKLIENEASISLVDNANESADTLTIDVVGAIYRPKKDDIIEVWFGYDDQLTFFGKFSVEESERRDDYFLSISATSASFTNTLKEKRNVSYDKLTISQICEQIAKRHNLELKSDFEDIRTLTIAQSNESDLHFLNRLAREYGAVFNIKNESVIFRKKWQDLEIHPSLPRYKIDKRNIKPGTLSIKYLKQSEYKSAKAIWHDMNENMLLEEQFGEGEPTLLLRGAYTSKEDAAHKAKGALQLATERTRSGSLTVEGGAYFSGGVVVLSGTFEDDGEYRISKVEHTMSESGWESKIEIKR